MDSVQTKQKDFIFDGVEFSSNFESGNLAQVMVKQANTFNLWIEADPSSSYKTWFYFSVKGIAVGTTVTFCIANMSNQIKLLKQGHLPVFKTDQNQKWGRIKIPIQQNGVVKVQQGFQLTFKHQFLTNCKHYFAFSYPWTTIQNNLFINKLIYQHSSRCFMEYKKLTSSFKGRLVNLLTITKLTAQNQHSNIQIPSNEECTPFVFKNKKGIFISARVHPGQIASSYILNGFLKYLLSNEQEANQLLKEFVFYIVPIINPDGVADGNFRTDSLGKNLNRFYTDPSPKEQPQIFAIKSFLSKMIKDGFIHFCLDLHAHVNKQGAFMYGNSTGNLKDQMEVCLFPKLLEFNSEFLDYQSCNFSEKNMSSKDKSDEMSKQGASRVAIFKETGLISCWTLQCNYNSARVTNVLPKPTTEQLFKSISNGTITDKITPQKKEETVFLNIQQFQSIGKSIGESILDYYHLRGQTRFYNSKLKNWDSFRLNLALNVLRMIPFRFDNECRKLLTTINGNININEAINRVGQLIGLTSPKILNISISKDNKKVTSTKAVTSSKEVHHISSLSDNKIKQKKNSQQQKKVSSTNINKEVRVIPVKKAVSISKNIPPIPRKK